MKPKILVIDDNRDIAQALKVLFTINQLHCECVLSPAEGIERLKAERFDLVIQDMNFTADTTSGQEGIELFARIRGLYPDLPIILITAWTHLETAVELVKQGAADYLSKPWDDARLLTTVNNLLELGELQRHQRQSQGRQQQQRQALAESYDLCGLRFRSPAMMDLLQLTTRVAHADVAVLITGPNGAGKEKIAEIVQANSACKDGPFVKVNVGALSRDLMEAELFGAEAGAYTGITKRRIGRFERADGGTLFLDEIGNLSLDGQAKLLRVLETGEFERIGGGETIKVKVRIISATNADLADAIRQGQFREDLFYRLNVIELALPPLYERKEDVLPLAELFLNGEFQLTEEAQRKLTAYHWPGNVRELQNVIKRAMLIAQSRLIEAGDIGVTAAIAPALTPVAEPEKSDIVEALASCSGVVAEAARSLGLSRSALYRRMKKFGIEG